MVMRMRMVIAMTGVALARFVDPQAAASHSAQAHTPQTIRRIHKSVAPSHLQDNAVKADMVQISRYTLSRQQIATR